MWRGWVDKTSPQATKRHPHFSFGRQSAVPDHWYFYLYDGAWGQALIKLSPNAPYGLWVMANGHEWAKRRLARTGVGFTELDNGPWTVEDPDAARRIRASLGAGHLRGLINRWLPSLPSPLTVPDRRAEFDWAWSVRQLEIADTAVFDRPAAGRAWFEAAIRDHVDLGRPDKVRIIFGRQLRLRGKNQTPVSFTTQVITPGTRARIEIRYKTSGAKAYLKEGRALRVETTVNNPEHFELRKTLNVKNWRALRRVGNEVNARFLEALGEGAAGPPDAATLQAIVLPTVHDGQRAPGLRFGEPRVMALLASVANTSPAGSPTPAYASTWPTSTTPTTTPAKPPTTCAGSASKASSNASPAPTPTASPPTAGRSPASSLASPPHRGPGPQRPRHPPAASPARSHSRRVGLALL